MIWFQKGSKPLSEHMITQFSRDVYASLGLNELTQYLYLFGMV